MKSAVAFGGAALLAAALVLSAPDVRADVLEDRIAEIKALEKTDEASCAAKVLELKDSLGDARVVAALKEWALQSRSEKVGPAAVKALAGREPADVDFLKTLLGKFDERDLYERKDGRPEFYKACLEGVAAAPYRRDKAAVAVVKRAQPDVLKLFRKFTAENSEFAGRLASVYAMALDADTLATLLKEAESLDAVGLSVGGGGGTGGKTVSAEIRKVMGESKMGVVDAMNAMTGQDIGEVSAWRKWWNDKGKAFKFPEPAAATPAPSPPKVDATAARYEDAGYGFACAKPDGASWTWAKPDFDGPRVMLTCADPANPKWLMAQAYFAVHPAARERPHTVKDFAQWVIDNWFREQLEPDEKHPPSVATMKLGDAEWTVVMVNGNGAGVRKAWASHERRVYLTKLGTSILWVDASVGLGAPEDVKTAFWHALDTMTVPVEKKK